MRRARGIARLRALEAQLMAKGTTAPCDVLEEHSGIPCPDGYTLYRNPTPGLVAFLV